MSRIRLNLERAAIQITRMVGARWGEHFPFYYVMEYPKSGGSWLADMIADYLQIPRPVMPVMPLGFKCVVHGHWNYSPRFRRVFYLVRDGRDVVTSVYFRIVREIEDPPYASSPDYYRRRFPVLFDPKRDRHDPSQVLPAFIEEWVRNPAGTRLSWPEHVAQWSNRPHVALVTYEELLRDTEGTLARLLPIHTGEPVDPDRLRATITKFSFERQSGRKPGQEVRGAILRKGIAGDWRNHFTREAAEIFDRYCGETLVRLGYECSRSWPKDLTP